jgi:aspartyl-tRNA(Asn)/glutamyl-tRNA(Gln) amidotransferase subunit A
VALAALSLARLELLGSQYNAVVTLMRDSALAEARAAEKEINSGHYRGPLHGIPYGVKDLLATKAVPTTWGAEPYRHQVFEFDATVVEKLRAAGAVLVAKLAMVELAGGMGYNNADASFTGPGLTPWNTKFWSGGSSSGPGAAVSAGLVPFAIGSETSGSILTPSAYCGVTGLRPTYGLVSRHGAMALCWTLTTSSADGADGGRRGARSVAIAGAGSQGRDGGESPLRLSHLHDAAEKLRIAVPKGVIEKVQPEVRDNSALDGDSREARHRDARHRVARLPVGPAISAIVSGEGAERVPRSARVGRKELRCPADRSGGYSALLLPAVDYLHAMRLRRPMKAAVAKLFEHYDVILSPTRATVAYPTDKNFEDAYPGVGGGPPLIPAANLCGSSRALYAERVRRGTDCPRRSPRSAPRSPRAFSSRSATHSRPRRTGTPGGRRKRRSLPKEES